MPIDATNTTEETASENIPSEASQETAKTDIIAAEISSATLEDLDAIQSLIDARRAELQPTGDKPTTFDMEGLEDE